MVGVTVSHYRVVSTLGRGGMGVVYLAEDARLHRKVALKFIEGSDPGSEARLVREAQSACTLDHPSIATVYEIGEWNGRPFIAMAYYEGQTLKDRIAAGPIPAADARRMAFEIASGLAAAHAAGIVHRDLKPGNILITNTGHVKILDFGLAKQLTAPETDTATQLTAAGTTLGTLAYMAPEQTAGAGTGSAADIWSFGVVLYELLTRRRPFEGATPTATLMAIVSAEPAPIETANPDAPADLCDIARRALVKAPERRTITAADIARALEPSASTMPAAPAQRWSVAAKAAVGVVVVAIAAAATWGYQRYSRTRWATAVAVPEAQKLLARGRNVDAFELARAARQAQDSPDVARLWSDASRRISITTTPDGASVRVRDVNGTKWILLGAAPLANVDIPAGPLLIRAEKPGFAAADDILNPNARQAVLALAPEGSVPEGMVSAPAAQGVPIYLLPGADPVVVGYPRFWLDRTEVTNRAYKAFIDAGGYTQRRWWPDTFMRGSTALRREEAMRLLVDATGRPGPSTWEGGTFPAGQDDYPVRGTNWYEASAYAAFAGKRLPTIYHWRAESAQFAITDLLPLVNVNGTGPRPGGAGGAPARGGAIDLLGNVKEWVANSAGGNLRYILGGAWDEPAYMAVEPDTRDAFERAANFGFRCARFDPGDASVDRFSGEVLQPTRDFTVETPVDDRVFEAYKRFYAFDRSELNAVVSARDVTPTDWTMETVTFAAAYGGETVTLRVFIPKHGAPPFQTIVYLPGASQFTARTTLIESDSRFFGHLVRSGRIVAYPVLKGAFERGTPQFTLDTPKDSALWRDYAVAWHKDLVRTIDYLVTRSDVDAARIGYMGLSRGAAIAPVTLALEPRIKAAALLIPGFYLVRPAPEVDVFNFTPRVKQPVLMLSGRYDSIFPARSQEPFFNTLGTPPEQKTRIVYDSGHNIPVPDMIRETLAWFDRYLGPAPAPR